MDVTRDVADVPAVEVLGTTAVHLMSAAAVHLGLAEDLPDHRDLDEARLCFLSKCRVSLFFLKDSLLNTSPQITHCGLT